MWSVLNGTVINAVAVVIGTACGLALSTKLPDRYQRIILTSLGLVTLTLGIDAAVIVMGDTVATYRPDGPDGRTYGARLAMVMIGCLVVGVIIGTALRLQDRLDGLGAALHNRFGGGGNAATFAEGFLSASVIFCVGPLTLLGCLANGASGDPSLLQIKSVLDLFCAAALATTLGIGVGFSVITVVVLQGGLSLAAYFLAGELPDLSIRLMNVVGGIVLLATAMLLLDLKKIAVADMLPGIFLPPVVVWVAEAIKPGILIAGAWSPGIAC